MTPTATEIAWSAGLFEGEGTITLSGTSKSPRLKLSMVDRDIVQRFANIVEGGHLCTWKVKNPKHKKQLCWYTGKKPEVARILELLMPFFGKRRLARAKVVHTRCFRYGLQKRIRGFYEKR